MRYEQPIMDIMYLKQLCVVATSSIQPGDFDDVDEEYGNIPGDGF